MRKYVTLLGAGLMTLCLPACCVGHDMHHSQLNTAEQLERKTVALVKWITMDADGDAVEVTPDDKGAELRSYCTGVWINHDKILTAAHCVSDIGEPDQQKLMEQMFPKQTLEELGFKPWDPI